MGPPSGTDCLVQLCPRVRQTEKQVFAPGLPTSGKGFHFGFLFINFSPFALLLRFLSLLIVFTCLLFVGICTKKYRSLYLHHFTHILSMCSLWVLVCKYRITEIP